MGATVVLGVCAVTAAFARDSRRTVVPYPAGGQTVRGVRPTAVGLPDLGTSGTLLVTGLAKAFRTYHDSGSYEHDLAAVDGAAEQYVQQRLAAARTPRRVCSVSYRRVPHIPGRGTLYRRVRRCRTRTERLSGRPAVVLDIDETALSNYAELSAHDFGFCACGLRPDAPAIRPTLRLYKDALAHGVAVFFVTGRPSLTESITRLNLRRVGYDEGWAGLYEKPVGAGTKPFKSSARATIERRGYDIVANVGDQQSDLDGGHADRQFKLPDPFYFISD